MDMVSTKLNSCFSSWVLLVLCGGAALNVSGQETGNARGPIIDMPYEIVSGWLDPFQEKGFAFGGNSAIWAETQDRIIINQRGETILPYPIQRFCRICWVTGN